MSGEQSSTFTGETGPEGPPDFDSDAVGRVVLKIQLDTVDLVGLHFQTHDIAPLETDGGGPEPEEVSLGVEWAFRRDSAELGCAVSCSILNPVAGSEGEEQKVAYLFECRFRLMYSVDDPEEQLGGDDFDQFCHWNAVFNAWPYFREILQSTLPRAGFSPKVLPVFRMPKYRS